MSSLFNKFEFVGSNEESEKRCGCCSSEIHLRDVNFVIQPFQNEIFGTLFHNFQLTSDIICRSCNEQLNNVHFFHREVNEKRRTFHMLAFEPKIKLELDDLSDGAAIKTEFQSPEHEHDYEALYEEPITCEPPTYLVEVTEKELSRKKRAGVKRESQEDIFPPVKKKIRRPRHEQNDGRRKAGITYICVICKNFTSDNKKDYNDHILENHAINHQKDVKPVEDPRSKMIESRPLPEQNCFVYCDYCGSAFNSKKNLYAHMKVHVDKRNQVKCIDCGKLFRDLRAMIRHRNHWHGKGAKFWCYCGNEFDNKIDLNRCRYSHGRNKVPEKLEDTCYECKIPRGFKSSRLLLAHKNKYHSEGSRFWCVRCGVIYKTKKEQTICTRNHWTDVLKDILIKCPECDKELLHNSLDIHLRSVHRQARDIVCHQCGKGFCAIARLTVHIKQVHNNGIKPWTCDYCGRSWAQKKAMRDHIIKTHSTDRKKFKCPICNKICANALDKHMRLVHPNGYDNGVKVNPETNLYHCPNCIQTFKLMKVYEWHVNENLCENYGGFEIDQSQIEGKRFSVFTEGK